MDYYPIVSHHLSKPSLNLKSLSPLQKKVNQNINCNNQLIHKTYSSNNNNNNKGSDRNIQCIINPKDYSDKKSISNTKKKSFKGPSSTKLAFNENNSKLQKENELLRLQITELKNENQELREQNMQYSHQLSKTKLNIIDLSILKRENSIKNNEDGNKLSESSLLNPTPQSFNHTIVSFNHSNKNQSKISRLKKKTELYQSIDALPLFTQRTSGTNLTLIANTSNESNNNSIAIKLYTLRKRIGDTLNMYNRKLTEKSNNKNII